MADERADRIEEPDADPDPHADTDAGADPGADASAGSGPDPDGDAHRESAYDLLQRGAALLASHHHAQAAIVLERADRLEPHRASILEALGRAYFNSGQHERARETFERLLELDPSAHYAHYALGQSLKRLGRPSEAGTHLRLAVALDPASTLYRGALERLGPDARPRRSSTSTSREDASGEHTAHDPAHGDDRTGHAEDGSGAT